MKQNELWFRVEKEAKTYVKSSGRSLVTGLINKDPSLTKEDIISELMEKVTIKLMNDLNRKLTPAFFRKVFKNELLNWIKHNNTQYRDRGYTISYNEEPLDDEEILSLNILPGGMQSEEPTPEDYMIAKQLEEFTDKYFEEDELDVLFGKVSCKDMAERLGIPYSTYDGSLNRKIKKFKIEAEEEGYI